MKMPKNNFGNSSTSFHKKPDTSLFVLKPCLRTIYLESDIQEDFDTKNQFKLRNLPCPQKNWDAVCKFYVDRGLNDPSIIRNTAHVGFNNKNLVDVRFC